MKPRRRASDLRKRSRNYGNRRKVAGYRFQFASSPSAPESDVRSSTWNERVPPSRAGPCRIKFLALVAVAFFATTPVRVAGESVLGDPEERIIGYENADGLGDPVSVLKQQMASGKSHLIFEPEQGYLHSLLKALQVPVSSQVLVFSKTSSQSDHVSPRTPRAIYFNQDTYVAWAPGAPEIDLASVDPTRGPIF